MMDCIVSDLELITQKEKCRLHKIGSLAFNLGFHAVLLYRIANWFFRHRMMPVAVVISYINSVLTGSQISPRAMIGKGFEIMHPQGVIIGPTTIGERCQLGSGVVIGQRYGHEDRPKIGDHFSAGTGAKLLGQIEIGDYVQVGANSVVLESLPSFVTAIGIPARIIAKHNRPTAGGPWNPLEVDSELIGEFGTSTSDFSRSVSESIEVPSATRT
jgi:serine O-acetyltransferase